MSYTAPEDRTDFEPGVPESEVITPENDHITSGFDPEADFNPDSLDSGDKDFDPDSLDGGSGDNFHEIGDDDPDEVTESVWGGLGGEVIPEGLVSGTYIFKLTKISRTKNVDKGTNSVVYTWEVDDENSDLMGFDFPVWHNEYPKLAAQIKAGTISRPDLAKAYKQMNWHKDYLKRLGMREYLINQGKWADIQALVGTRKVIEIVVPSGENAGFPKVKSMTDAPGYVEPTVSVPDSFVDF